MLRLRNRRHPRLGVFLPIVAILMLLVMLSVLIVASFGSETRKLLKRAEMSEVCRVAAISAIRELRVAVDNDLQGDDDTWPQWWKEMLPPYSGLPSSKMPNAKAPATKAAFARSQIQLSGLAVSCLDRRTGHKVKAQGLLEFVVTAQWKGKGFKKVAVTRSERVRFLVQYKTVGEIPDPSNPAVSYPIVEPSIMLIPLCGEEREGDGV